VKLLVIDGAGHFVSVEQPDSFTRTVRDFMT